MHTRLARIIDYKTAGRQNRFAELMGWTPQYLAKLLKGSIGLSPVLTVLEKLPEINARWLLLGQGEMITEQHRKELSLQASEAASILLEYERYIPVMDADEIEQFQSSLVSGELPIFSPDRIHVWQSRLTEKNLAITKQVHSAMIKSEELCKQRTARK